MTIRFADSSPFPYGPDFLTALEAAIEACVDILRIDERVEGLLHEQDLVRARAEFDLERLEMLAGQVKQVVAAYSDDGSSPIATQIAGKIDRSTAELMKGSRRKVNAWRKIQEEERAKLLDGHRGEVGVILSRLLEHRLPGVEWNLRWRAGVGDAPTDAYHHAITTFGLEAVMGVELGATHPAGRPIPVAELVPEAELRIDSGGFFSRGPRATALKSWVVTDVEVTAERAALTLRPGAKKGKGVEIELSTAGQSMPRWRSIDDAAWNRFEATDLATVSRLFSRVDGRLRDALKGPRRMVRASFEGALLADVRRPALIVEKIIASLAPIVHEMLARGTEDRTLVLYRRGVEGRDERVSLALDKLVGRGRDLTPGRRSLFVALVPGAPRLDSRLKPHRELSEIRLEDMPTGQYHQRDPRDVLPVKLPLKVAKAAAG